MPESTLQTAYKDLKAAIAFELGYGRGADFGETTWDDQQTSAVDECLKSALRRFYYPEMLDGQVDSYEWSFLRPVVSLSLAEGEQTVTLPDDFNALQGTPTLGGGTVNANWDLMVVGENDIRRNYSQTPAATGRPLYVAVTPLREQPMQGQRWQLKVYPIADIAYTLDAAYDLNPDYLTGTYPYAYGGPQHAETLKAAGLAAAEFYLDGAMGSREEYFQKRLQASVSMDRRLKPQQLGLNRDDSDAKATARQLRSLWPSRGITYNSTSYG